jgi:alanyl-tRNA synthetase
MQGLSAAQIRSKYLDFFVRHNHTLVPSSSLVVSGDPTLLFANSGMVQFKDLFLGVEQRPYTRAVTAQKCLRVSGKHNDLEEVGPSPRHHTFFEMLGNFSFGDYFKETAIPLSWKLLTEAFQLPVERLWFTVFEGAPGVPADDEAARLWEQAGADPARIRRFGEADNYWVMGDTGPSGPCSEITVYIGDDLSKMSPDGVNSDDPDYVEVWNNVFMQYERSTMQPLPRPSVDTGMGLERMAMVLQGVHSTYDTDLFVPLIERTMALVGSDYADYRAQLAPYRAIADHSRAVTFLIAEGVLPGNSGRSYVLRRILRRAVYQGRRLGLERPFLAEVVRQVVADMGEAYPELQQRRAFILDAVGAEEEQFLRTLSGGMVMLNSLVTQVQNEGSKTIPGSSAFQLKDTYGFPLDLTEKIAGEQGLAVDVRGFNAEMQAQRERSRAAAQFKRGVDLDVWVDQELPETEFLGYAALHSPARVLALVFAGDDVANAQAGQEVQLVLDRTPFYAESGGQVGDTGTLKTAEALLRIRDTQRPLPGLIVHYGIVEQGSIARGDSVEATVDAQRRAAIQRNHTATHMLHRVLRDLLGEHAAQAGSLVAPERLRFDFTHTRALEAGQLRTIEQRLNDWVRADGRVSWATMDYQAALDAGAIALFGEKYGDQVRVVSITRGSGDEQPGADQFIPSPQMPQPLESYASRVSRELCGGTHVLHTGEIGYVRIIGESSVGSGLRRIEALSGAVAEQWAEEQAATLRELAGRVGVAPHQLADRIEALLAEQKQRQQEIEQLRFQVTRGALEDLLSHVQAVGDIPLLVARVEADEANQLRGMGDWLRNKLGSAVIVLGTVINAKPQLLAMVTADLTGRGLHAGNLIKSLARHVGGGGGGRPEMAQAGGRDVNKLADALAEVPDLVRGQAGQHSEASNV